MTPAEYEVIKIRRNFNGETIKLNRTISGTLTPVHERYFLKIYAKN